MRSSLRCHPKGIGFGLNPWVVPVTIPAIQSMWIRRVVCMHPDISTVHLLWEISATEPVVVAIPLSSKRPIKVVQWPGNGPHGRAVAALTPVKR